MRILRFTRPGTPDAQPEIGIQIQDPSGDLVVPLSAVAPDASQDMIALIAAWDAIAPQLADVAAHRAEALPLVDLTLAAPVPNPQKILAIGLNYADHIEETGLPTPTNQLWFSKLPNAVNAPHGDIELPRTGTQMDWEVEMVAVIGKGGRHISAAEAPPMSSAMRSAMTSVCATGR